MLTSQIPEEMLRLPNWVCWQYEKNQDGKRTKVPYQYDMTVHAKSNDPKTWTTFENVVSTALHFDGIGFQAGLEPCGIFLLDLDDCIVDGEFKPWAKEILVITKTYTESSPSGKGLHIYGKGRLPGPCLNCRNVDGGAEIYDRTHYFTVTGKRDPVYTDNFRELSDEEMRLVYELVQKRKPKATIFTPSKPTVRNNLGDNDLLQRMFAAKNGMKIQSLYNGNTADYGGDESAADSALCWHFAFWTNNDAGRMDNLFRSSGLMREKWDRKHSGDGRTYGAMTIDHAIANCSKTISDGMVQRQEQIEHTAAGTSLDETRSNKCSVTRPIDCMEKVNDLYLNGHKRGIELEWRDMKPLMRIVRAWIYVFTGYPGDGKTEFMLDIAMRLAKTEKFKWAVFSPENYPVEDLLSNLLEKSLKKNFFGQGRMTEEEVKNKMSGLINDHFVILGEKDESVSMDSILNTVKDLDVDGVIIDPYNEIEGSRPVNMSVTEFIGHNLIRLRRFAKQYNKFTFISAHPAKPKPDNKGNFQPPNLYSIADSAHWKNKADMGVWVYRNEETKLTDIHVLKVRGKYNGQKGMASLQFDKVTGTFSDNDDNM